jgi:hypothetical protein
MTKIEITDYQAWILLNGVSVILPRNIQAEKGMPWSTLEKFLKVKQELSAFEEALQKTPNVLVAELKTKTNDREFPTFEFEEWQDLVRGEEGLVLQLITE